MTCNREQTVVVRSKCFCATTCKEEQGTGVERLPGRRGQDNLSAGQVLLIYKCFAKEEALLALEKQDVLLGDFWCGACMHDPPPSKCKAMTYIWHIYVCGQPRLLLRIIWQ